MVTETPDLLPNPFASYSNWFVGDHLRSEPQSILGGWHDADAKIRSVDDFRSHLADDDRRMRFGKRISLDDHRRTRLTMVTRRRDNDDLVPWHAVAKADRADAPAGRRAAHGDAVQHPRQREAQA